MSFKRLNTRFCLVIPDLHEFIVASGNEIGLVAAVVVVDVIDSLIVGIESEIGGGGGEGPDFDGPIEARGGECVGIFGVDGEGHDVVAMSFKDSYTFPILLPVPEFDCHIVGPCEHEWLSGMNRNASDVTAMSHNFKARLTLDELQKT